jgi:hypothetical protein
VHEELLQQSRSLATVDPRKPQQVNLRRAVSSAYYALFHFLVDQACRSLIGTQHRQLSFRNVLARAFEHGTMKEACKSFAGGTLKAAVAKGLPAKFRISTDVQGVARTFVELQEKRHIADYDRSERFRRADVLALIRQVDRAMVRYREIKSSTQKRFFLACLLSWKALTQRG